MGYIGGVVGLSTSSDIWYDDVRTLEDESTEDTSAVYVMGAMNGKGQASLGIINNHSLTWFILHNIRGEARGVVPGAATVVCDVLRRFYCII